MLLLPYVVADNRFVVDGLLRIILGGLPHQFQHILLWRTVWEHRAKLHDAKWIKVHLTEAEVVKRGWTAAQWRGLVRG